jgi:solute carrier family 30 (zinc transporter), member 1
LGALINGVFLVALCLSIFLEAIQRFVEPQVVSNPMLVLIVGCLGLASNVLGLFLFHDHGHSHGCEGEHSHEHDPISNAEEGHSHVHEEEEDTNRIGSQTGNIEDVPPQSVVHGWYKKKGSDVHGHSHEFTTSDEDDTTVSGPTSGGPTRKSTVSNGEIHNRRHRRTSGSFGRGFGSVENIHIHPASFRHDIILASRLEAQPESEPEEEAIYDDDETPPSPNENSKLMKYANGSPRKTSPKKRKSTDHHHDSWHVGHHHNQPKDQGDKSGHGHSHGNLNMRGVFLHVMGDALGNIGVIASALFIWLTHFEWRYYVDPGVSLIITVIILTSAIPLCKAASRILLQAVPTGMSIDDIKADIEELPRIISAHHIHVWQLSDTKLVASLHVQVNCDVEGESSASYMHLAKQIRKCLHGYGIHSSTIQPEFFSPSGNPTEAPGAEDQSGTISPKRAGSGGKGSKAGSVRSGAGAVCLLDCGDDCADKNQCCPLK